MRQPKSHSAADREKEFHYMNDVIMDIARTYIRWHDKEQKFGIKEDLCRAEIHTIQAIGNNDGINVTRLARILKVTKPTVSERISKFSKLKLVIKRASRANNKEVVLALTDKGWIAYQSHEKKHHKIYSLFRDYFGSKSSSFIRSFMKDLRLFSQFLTFIKKKKEFS